MEHTTILDELEREGYVVISIHGVSMLPLLRETSSQVMIRRLDGRPKKNDVVLYVRPDGSHVLHRLIRYDGDACLIRGDNTFFLERVMLSDVMGTMEIFWRGNHEISAMSLSYRAYVWIWNLVYPLRWFKHKMVQALKRILRHVVGRYERNS